MKEQQTQLNSLCNGPNSYLLAFSRLQGKEKLAPSSSLLMTDLNRANCSGLK